MAVKINDIGKLGQVLPLKNEKAPIEKQRTDRERRGGGRVREKEEEKERECGEDNELRIQLVYKHRKYTNIEICRSRTKKLECCQLLGYFSLTN